MRDNEKEKEFNKNREICDFVISLIEKLHKEYLIINRICYKVKNQFGKQKQYHYLIQIKKFLYKMFNLNKRNINKKNNEIILKEFIKENYFNMEKNESFNEVLLKLGKIIEEMLKLKLYHSYSIIILGIISRIYTIFYYFNKNKEIIEKSFGIKERKNEDNDTIFVKNIPFSASKEKLIELFEKNFGKIIDVYWPKEQDSGFRMNYAFIQFDSTKSAKKAVEYGIISYEEEDDETDFLDGNKEKRNYPLRISYSTNRKMINNSHRKSHLNKNKFRKYKINYKDKNFKKRDRSRKKNFDDNSKSSSSLSDSFDKKKKEKSSSSSSFNSESD